MIRLDHRRVFVLEVHSKSIWAALEEEANRFLRSYAVRRDIDTNFRERIAHFRFSSVFFARVSVPPPSHFIHSLARIPRTQSFGTEFHLLRLDCSLMTSARVSQRPRCDWRLLIERDSSMRARSMPIWWQIDHISRFGCDLSLFQLEPMRVQREWVFRQGFSTAVAAHGQWRKCEIIERSRCEWNFFLNLDLWGGLQAECSVLWFQKQLDFKWTRTESGKLEWSLTKMSGYQPSKLFQVILPVRGPHFQVFHEKSPILPNISMPTAFQPV